MLDASGTSPQRPIRAELIPQRPGSGIQDPFHTAVLCLNSDMVSPWKPYETTKGKKQERLTNLSRVHTRNSQSESYMISMAFFGSCLPRSRVWKELKTREKFSLSSFFFFAIRVYLIHPCPSLFLYDLPLSLLCSFILVNNYF